jgi:hypothetical protein
MGVPLPGSECRFAPTFSQVRQAPPPRGSPPPATRPAPQPRLAATLDTTISHCSHVGHKRLDVTTSALTANDTPIEVRDNGVVDLTLGADSESGGEREVG